MAQIEITIRRDNGTTVTAGGTVDDIYVADIAMTLTALLFDSASVPAAEPVALAPQPEPVRAAAPPADAAPEAPMPAPPGARRDTV